MSGGRCSAILLISQFWTLANGIFDPRQAKRLFGFIGGGVMLGGMAGSGLTALIVKSVGTNTLLLVSAAALLASMVTASRGDRPRAAGRRQSRRRSRRNAASLRTRSAAAARFTADPAHCGGHQLRLLRCRAARSAGQHGDGDLQRRRPGRLDRRVPRPDPLLHLAGGLRHPGLDHAAHPPLSRHRLRADDAADQPADRGGRRCSTPRCGRRGSPASPITRSATRSTRRPAKCSSCRCPRSCGRR